MQSIKFSFFFDRSFIYLWHHLDFPMKLFITLNPLLSWKRFRRETKFKKVKEHFLVIRRRKRNFRHQFPQTFPLIYAFRWNLSREGKSTFKLTKSQGREKEKKLKSFVIVEEILLIFIINPFYAPLPFMSSLLKRRKSSGKKVFLKRNRHFHGFELLFFCNRLHLTLDTMITQHKAYFARN